MPALDAFARQQLQLQESHNHRRTVRTFARTEGVNVVREGRKLISFSCNDYLGLTHDLRVLAAGKKALQEYGAGAGASRLVTGNHPFYDDLEALLAEMKHAEAACVFGSGYLANLGSIPALVGKPDMIIADKLVHACMLDGARLSGATLMRFAHNNLDHCRLILEQNRGDYERCLILTETVFSMDGDLGPVVELAELAQAHDAWLMTDDAHGFGLVAGGEADVQIGTLSKAAGAYGGYACGKKDVIEYLKTSARSLVYSTGLPPAVVASAIAALRIMKEEPQHALKALENAQRFTNALKLPEARSAIVPLILGAEDMALAASQLLEKEGYLVSAIRPPTVPPDTARLRFAFSSLHTPEQIGALTAIIRREGWQCAQPA